MQSNAHLSVAPEPPEPRTLYRQKYLSARALAALVSQLTTGYPSHESRGAAGPLDRYIRRALERSVLGNAGGAHVWRVIAEKHPEIWEVIGGDPATLVALNPQPLPPRPAFLAAVVLEFTERMANVGELADLIPRPGGEPGHAIVAAHVARFVDDVCDSALRVHWPYPWPAPPWFSEFLSGADLVVMGTQFQQASVVAMDRDLGRTFADAAHALLEAGAARLA